MRSYAFRYLNPYKTIQKTRDHLGRQSAPASDGECPYFARFESTLPVWDLIGKALQTSVSNFTKEEKAKADAYKEEIAKETLEASGRTAKKITILYPASATKKKRKEGTERTENEVDSDPGPPKKKAGATAPVESIRIPRPPRKQKQPHIKNVDTEDGPKPPKKVPSINFGPGRLEATTGLPIDGAAASASGATPTFVCALPLQQRSMPTPPKSAHISCTPHARARSHHFDYAARRVPPPLQAAALLSPSACVRTWSNFRVFAPPQSPYSRAYSRLPDRPRARRIPQLRPYPAGTKTLIAWCTLSDTAPATGPTITRPPR
ncbi:hypothetical protein DFH09DRAFT_1339016 [Mycena vulgaris]|nr:hypothetical protein DFH09DRAFT_1339016 [Mycena vulgaris]